MKSYRVLPFHHGYPTPNTLFAFLVLAASIFAPGEEYPKKVPIINRHGSGVWELPALLLSSHSATGLSSLLQTIVGLRGMNLTIGQQLAISKFHHLKPKLLAFPTLMIETFNIMNQIYDLFDQLFFRRTMSMGKEAPEGRQPLCHIQVVDARHLLDAEADIATPYGALDHRIRVPDKYATSIRLSNHHPKGLSRELELKYHLEDLLHETVHGFFNIYLCLCDTCHEQTIVDVGVTGHRSGWQVAALAVEKAAKEISGEELDLGRKSGFDCSTPTWKEGLGEEEIASFEFGK